MLSNVISGAIHGLDAVRVDVEVSPGGQGEPKPVLVGLPASGVRESMDRVWAALGNSGFNPPGYKVTINLAPGSLRKEGPLYDLPIALAVLQVTSQFRPSGMGNYLIAGELGLSGEVRDVRGGLSFALLARDLGLDGLILPPRTAEEAALVQEVEVYPVKTLLEARAFLEGSIRINPLERHFVPEPPEVIAPGLDFAEVKGQQALRRAVEVAVSGAHGILIQGPPGSGKSLVAKRIPTIMPALREEEYLDILRIYSVSGKTLHGEGIRPIRPFRSPHHTISDVGLIGGGSLPGPGEISLAHHGVLFLDEMPEFKRSALEVLRQPMEDGQVTISRSAGNITLPARFMLVAAMNPTPCGGVPGKITSTPAQIQRYRNRISGPLLDRIDLHAEAPALTIGELREAAPGESSHCIRERVELARKIQRNRFTEEPYAVNAVMPPAAIRRYCAIPTELGKILQQAMEKLELSARAYDRILKVSRTIADLAGEKDIQMPHLLEAIQYRSFDRQQR